MRGRGTRDTNHRLGVGFREVHGDVVPNRSFKQQAVLGNDADLLTHTAQAHFADVVTVYQDSTFIGLYSRGSSFISVFLPLPLAHDADKAARWNA